MVEVRFHVNHLDRLPRCVVTRLAVPFCSHCSLNSTQGVRDRSDLAPRPAAVSQPFHNLNTTQQEQANRGV